MTLCHGGFTLVDTVTVSFQHAGLRELFETGASRKVQPGRHAMAVSGPWLVTFRWDGKDAHGLALEQYR